MTVVVAPLPTKTVTRLARSSLCSTANGNIVILSDESSDGIFDKRKVFLDKLLLPRIMPDVIARSWEDKVGQ